MRAYFVNVFVVVVISIYWIEIRDILNMEFFDCVYRSVPVFLYDSKCLAERFDQNTGSVRFSNRIHLFSYLLCSLYSSIH